MYPDLHRTQLSFDSHNQARIDLLHSTPAATSPSCRTLSPSYRAVVENDNGGAKSPSTKHLPQLSNPPPSAFAGTPQKICLNSCSWSVSTISPMCCAFHRIWIDQWLDNAPTDVPYRRNIIYMLIKLAERSGELPQSLFIRGVDIGSSRDPYRIGGFSDVYFGTYLGKRVAVKRLRISDEEKTTVHAVGVSLSLHSSDIVTHSASSRPSVGKL